MKKIIFGIIIFLILMITNVFAGGVTFLNTDFEGTDYSNKHLKVLSLEMILDNRVFYTLYTDGIVEYYELIDNKEEINRSTYNLSYEDVCSINQPFLNRVREDEYMPITLEIPINIKYYSEEGIELFNTISLNDSAEARALEVMIEKNPYYIKKEKQNIKLQDIQNTKYEKAVYELVSSEIVNGFEDGTYRPNEYVTRAQLAKMLTIALRINVDYSAYEKGGQFLLTDIENHWAYPYIKVGVENGIINGYDDKTFRPDNKVTYAESLTMMIRALGLENKMDEKIWPDSYTNEAYRIGLLINVDVNENDFNSAINRGETAIAIYNMINYDLHRDRFIEPIEEITEDLIEIPSGEVFKLSNQLKNKEYFQLATQGNFYNACLKKDSHILINNKDENNGVTYMIFDLSFDGTNGFNQYGGFAYHYLRDHASEFGYEIIEYDNTLISEFNNILYPQKAVLKYNNYYKIFNVTRNLIKDPNAEFVVDANEFGNFLAFVINNNSDIKVLDI